MNEPLAEFTPTTLGGAIAAVAILSFLGLGGGEWLFGGPSANQSRMMREEFEQTCIFGRDLNRHSDYCRTHKMDGSKMSADEIARRDRADTAREASRTVTSASKPSAADRADFEAILQEASR